MNDVRPGASTSLDFSQYLRLVQQNNLALAAQKAQIDIADAQIALAALFPDPTLTTGLASYEMTRDKLPTISTLNVNFTIEGGTKRELRTEVARADKARAQAEFARQLSSIQQDAALACVDYWRALELRRHWRSMLELVQSLQAPDAKRKDKPDLVSQVQLRAESTRAQAELDAAQADVHIFSRSLLMYARPASDGFVQPFEVSGTLAVPALEPSDFPDRSETREDVMTAKAGLEAARKREALANENRSLDMNFTVGVNHSRAGTFLSTPLPQSNSLMATLAVPIPFSLRQDGDLRAASAAATQAMKQYGELVSRAGLEGEQARARYTAAARQMQLYGQSAELTLTSLRAQAELFHAGKVELPDLILLLKLANEAHALATEARANHARSMITLLSQNRRLSALRFQGAAP